MKKELLIELRDYELSELKAVMHGHLVLKLSDDCVSAIKKGRAYLDDRLETRDEAIYGINTGFGSLCDTRINKEDLNRLQENLVKSHAAGSGKEVRAEIVRLMLFLKIVALSKGYSAIRLETIQRLIDFYNKDVLPIIYEQGSLGASGDLAPLAHLSLPLIGTGEVRIKSQRLPGEALHQQFGWQALVLESKEGIALLNGTQFMSAYASYILLRFGHLFEKANSIACISMEAFQARLQAFHPALHRIRKQHGQAYVAFEIREILKGSELQEEAVDFVQDPYSFRCIPQVHGAIWDNFSYVKQLVQNEINSISDNPTVFPEEDLILSGGNFHGEAIAMALDYLKIGMHELGNISERRIYKLIAGQRGLPAFLVAEPGLNSGFMIPQYTAASLVSRSKTLCFPNSVDTIDSSNGQEDHVSMGANAALSSLQVFELVEQVIGIEYFVACQALDFRTQAKSSATVEKMRSDLRKQVSFIERDCIMHEPMSIAQRLLRE